MKTLVLLPAPSDTDTAAGRYNTGLAGEMLRDLIMPYDSNPTYKYVAEINQLVYRDYTHILLVGERPKEWAEVKHYLYTYRRLNARIISVPDHTIALDLRKQKYIDEEEDSDEEEDDADNSKEIAPTRAVNYRYWIEKGVHKLFLLDPPKPRTPGTCFSPTLSQLSQFLSEATTIFVDIETRRNQEVFSGAVLDCIGIGRNNDDLVMVIPFYDYKGDLLLDNPIAYINLLSSFRGLWVLHNAMFDLSILCLFTGMRIPTHIYDTMVMHHRIAPEVEKSLGHLIGAYSEQPYHKHELIIPHRAIADEIVWKYNAKDVLGTKIIYYELLKEINKDIGLVCSVEVGCNAIIDYLEMTCTGLVVNLEGLTRAKKDLSAEVNRMTTVVNILAGRDLNVGSSQQLRVFFHDDHGYKPVAYSLKTKLPKLGKKELQLLALINRNPIIPLVIELKKLRKSNSMLEFKPL